MARTRIHRTLSRDGTQITGQVHGEGPPLVLVPGGPADGDTGWSSLLPHLTGRFTCFPINTRGRGMSADDPDHAHERLVEDVVAFVESIGDEVHLFGHSAGAAHALEAAASTGAVARLAVYEPTLTQLGDDELQARYEAAFASVRRAVRAGRPQEGAQIFVEELAMANEEELGVLAAVDATAQMAPLVPVVLEEVACSGAPNLSDLSVLDRLRLPVLVLHGSHTAAFYVEVAQWLRERLADVEVWELAGLGHLGPEVAPEPVARALTGFLAPAADAERSGVTSTAACL